MTLRARLALGFLAIAVLLVIPLAISLRALGDVRGNAEQLQSSNFAASQTLGRAVLGLAEVRAGEKGYTVLPDSIAGPALRRSLDSLSGILDTLARIDGDQAHAARTVQAALDTVRATLPELRALVDADSGGRADIVSQERVQPALDSAEQILNRIRESLERQAGSVALEAVTTASEATEVTYSAFSLSSSSRRRAISW